jgi:hypothetical protein
VHMRQEITGEYKEIHTEDLHDLCASPNILLLKSRRSKLVGRVARMDREKVRTGY